jgi:hypothetical protein
LPDGGITNYVIKPIKSSYSFSLPLDGTGDATMSLSVANPLGRVAELWYRDEDNSTGYSPPTMFNQAQLLKESYDYARFVKGYACVKSQTLPAGTYQLNGLAALTRYPYPASEKPSKDGSSSAFSKYSYDALTGVQSDPCNLVTAVNMKEEVILAEFGQFNQPALRLCDNIVTSNANTVVVANDARQSLNYVVAANLATNATINFPPAASSDPVYYRSARILVTGYGGITAEASYKGNFFCQFIGPYVFEVGYFMETFDLMGHPIETNTIVVTPKVGSTTDFEGVYRFDRTIKFIAPAVGSLLERPTIQQVQFGMYVRSLNSVNPLTVSNFSLDIDAEIHVVAGDAYGVGRPSSIWAVSGAKQLQFSLESMQWFEAIPNSNLLQTTTTIPVPHGDVMSIQDFWKGMEYLMNIGAWRYVWKGKEWKHKYIMGNDGGVCRHPAEMLTWKAQLPDIIAQIVECENGDCSSAKKFFHKLGHDLKKGGRSFSKVLQKEGLKLAKQYSPEVIDFAFKKAGSVLGLSDQEIQAAEHLLKPLLPKLAGGSLAGGSLTTGQFVNNNRRVARLSDLVGRCATQDIEDLFKITPGIKWKPLHTINNLSGNPNIYIPPPGEFKYRVKVINQPIGACADEGSNQEWNGAMTRGVCADKGWNLMPRDRIPIPESNSIPMPTSTITVDWKKTRGCFVPALFFVGSGSDLVVASGLYYLWIDRALHASQEDNWSRDSKGTKLVGHKDVTPLECILPKYACLMSVNSVTQGEGYDLTISGDFSKPAMGRSVEAACTALRFCEEAGTSFKMIAAITGDMIKPSNGLGWRFADMPDQYGFYKKKAVRTLLPFRIPIIGNWTGADIPVKTLSDLKKALHLNGAVRGMCATLSIEHCYPNPLIMWKNGYNSEFDLEGWFADYEMSILDQGQVIVADTEPTNFLMWIDNESKEKLKDIREIFASPARCMPGPRGGRRGGSGVNPRSSKAKKAVEPNQIEPRLGKELNELKVTLQALAKEVAGLKNNNSLPPQTRKSDPNKPKKGKVDLSEVLKNKLSMANVILEGLLSRGSIDEGIRDKGLTVNELFFKEPRGRRLEDLYIKVLTGFTKDEESNNKMLAPILKSSKISEEDLKTAGL